MVKLDSQNRYEEDVVYALRNNAERCKVVKVLRVELECSWRRVAELCHYMWDGVWYPPSHQLFGRALCDLAAEGLKEDPSEKSWN